MGLIRGSEDISAFRAVTRPCLFELRTAVALSVPAVGQADIDRADPKPATTVA
jgi:hypothetical protein